MEPGGAGERDRVIIQAGAGIELRHVSMADCAELYAAIDGNRAYLRQWLLFLHDGFSEKDLVEFVRAKELENAAGVSLTTAIRVDGKIRGVIGLHKINQRDRNTSIGYWLDAAHQGRGIMTRACRVIVTEGFRSYGLHRIEIRCATGNTRSAEIPRRLGFVEEGILREAEWLHDRWVDLRVFGMTESDWQRHSLNI